jgi:hypothetical protein
METIAVGNTNKSSERNINIAGVMFSEEEVKMMHLLSEGKTYKEIAVLIGQVSGKNGISYVKNRLSSKTHSASLLKRVGVESSKALATWYIEKTRPERITPVPVHQDMPWHRSNTALGTGLTVLYLVMVLNFFHYWSLPEKGTVDYLAVNIYILIPVVTRLFGYAKWWHPLKTERIDYGRRLLATKSFFNGLEGFSIAQMFWIGYYIYPTWLLFVVYALFFATYLFFRRGFLRIYDLHPHVGLLVPHFSRENTTVVPFWACIIGSIWLFYARGWSISLEGDPALVILQLLCILAGSIVLGLSIRHVYYVMRFSDYQPIKSEAVELLTATMVQVVGFFLFFVANMGFIITSSTSTQSIIASNRGGWVDFLYATACYVIGLGTLLMPLRVEQELVHWEEGGEGKDSGDIASVV